MGVRHLKVLVCNTPKNIPGCYATTRKSHIRIVKNPHFSRWKSLSGIVCNACGLCIMHNALYIIHYMRCIIHYTLYMIQSYMIIMQYTLYIIHHTSYITQIYNMQICTIHYPSYIIQSILHKTQYRGKMAFKYRLQYRWTVHHA